MKYSITRKINLGKYGLQYEALDIGVSEANSWEEAENEIKQELQKIDLAYREAKKPKNNLNDLPITGKEYAKK